ncbi:MAG: hypothetical protein MJ200_04020 [Mycoplasmoidaceae bacterium]|nr:hypothetical protein [Mycoplasmoidaceae bacterium]
MSVNADAMAVMSIGYLTSAIIQSDCSKIMVGLGISALSGIFCYSANIS